MNILVFILISFVVGFISDVVLNDLSRNVTIFSSLQPYFKNKLITESGLYAGITIAVATAILLFVFKHFFNKYLPTTQKELAIFLIIGYIFGYLLDVLICKSNIFGNSLKPYYESFGCGNSGAIAFIFSIVVSLFIFNYILV